MSDVFSFMVSGFTERNCPNFMTQGSENSAGCQDFPLFGMDMSHVNIIRLIERVRWSDISDWYTE